MSWRSWWRLTPWRSSGAPLSEKPAVASKSNDAQAERLRERVDDAAARRHLDVERVEVGIAHAVPQVRRGDRERQRRLVRPRAGIARCALALPTIVPASLPEGTRTLTETSASRGDGSALLTEARTRTARALLRDGLLEREHARRAEAVHVEVHGVDAHEAHVAVEAAEEREVGRARRDVGLGGVRDLDGEDVDGAPARRRT